MSQSRPQSKTKSKEKGLNLCVFCGSREGNDIEFSQFATRLGHLMAESDIGLVYGGGAVGLMGAVSDAVLTQGGRATGVIPEFLTGQVVSHRSAEMLVVPDMHTRKRKMFEHSDAFCILPGGVGTMDEFFEIVAWRQLSLHNKPVIVANWNGYWDHLINMASTAQTGGFAYGPMELLFTAVKHVDDILPTVRKELSVLEPISDPGHPRLT